MKKFNHNFCVNFRRMWNIKKKERKDLYMGSQEEVKKEI